jgi:iron(III) transport system substrate-binding protein
MALALVVGAAQAQTLNKVEQIYADLAKLPAKERAEKIEAGARREGKLTMINTYRGQNVQQTALFKKRYPFLDFDSLNDIGSQDAAERLFAEETAGRHLTDVVTGSITDFRPALDAEMIARYPTPAAAAILPRFNGFKDPENRWLPWLWSEHGVSYNSNLVPPDKAPKSWIDLCDPFFKGSVSFDPAETRYLVGLNAMFGEEKLVEFLKCMGANKPIIQRGHDQRIQLMLAGDHMAQGDNYFSQGVKAQREHGAPFAIALTAPILAMSGVAVINRNTQHPYAAALYADWLLSLENQELFSREYRGPLTIKHPYLPDDAQLVTFDDPPPETVKRLLGYWRTYMEPKK